MSTQIQSMTQEQMAEEIVKLRAENEGLKAQQKSKLVFKVSEKGAVSIYGLGRFPVTLYKSQAERLIECIPALQTWMQANAHLLTEKDKPEAKVNVA